MSTAAYIRVSTRDQKLDSQRNQVERYLVGQGLENVRWYEDHASGANTKRAGWQKLQVDIGKRAVKTVVVWKLDRAFRNALDCLRTVEEWDQLGVSLRIIDLGGQPIDTKAAGGKFMLTVMAAIAEMERTTLRERQSAGIEAAHKNGKRWGGSKPGRRHKLTTERQAAIRRLDQEGWSLSAIARSVGLARPTVRRALTTSSQQEESPSPPPADGTPPRPGSSS